MANISTRTKVIIENGKPTAVVLDIKKYEKLLELVKDKLDLAELRRIKKSKPSFKSLSTYLKKRV